jgi:hypothetical protein
MFPSQVSICSLCIAQSVLEPLPIPAMVHAAVDPACQWMLNAKLPATLATSPIQPLQRNAKAMGNGVL